LVNANGERDDERERRTANDGGWTLRQTKGDKRRIVRSLRYASLKNGNDRSGNHNTAQIF